MESSSSTDGGVESGIGIETGTGTAMLVMGTDTDTARGLVTSGKAAWFTGGGLMRGGMNVGLL